MNSNKRNEAKLQGLVAALAAYLRFEVEEGRGSTVMNRRILEGLTNCSAIRMRTIAAQILHCKKCPLHKSRTRVVPGEGSLHPEIMFVGEAPGEDEDRTGRPFVGKAGQLLTLMIESMGFTREEVFIGNILKCRPPNNRTPFPDEMEACFPYLREQIAVLKPKVIVALGATAAKGLLNLSSGISSLRGHWFRYEGIDVMPTYHPSYLLRTPEAKREAWEDLKAVLKRLGRKPPARVRRAAPSPGTPVGGSTH